VKNTENSFGVVSMWERLCTYSN